MKKQESFLKKRAREFLERAKEDFEKSRFNLSALDLEQAVQLWLKHLIFLKTADFPKTHYLDRLMKELSMIYESKKILNFYKKHSLEFRILEDAYLTSRYFAKEFNREEIEKLTEFVELFIKFLERQTNEKLI
ncbi:MAG: HEPN domain-containing protein [Candidatus Omnitrophica bacterium]|nr:HEPN domain-containing protein [Candidatus Omnitrophota bacterium]